MNKGIVLLIGLSILAAVPYFYDNTDNGVWSEEDKILVASMQKVYEQKEAERMANLGPTLEATANVCLNGKKPSSLTYEQNVNEFIKGPCSPVVLLPGIMGTSLQVKIDCELLWGENPEIFSNCGWGTCSWSIFKSRPSAEYRLWISTTTNPVAAIVRNKKDRCFGDIIQQIYDPTQKDPKDRYKNPYGLEVTWHGNTDETKSTSECGLRGVYEITDDILIKASMCDEQGFQSMRDLFLNMGYISGLTLQAIPYDWRKSIVASDSQKNIATSLENLYKIIGKKSYIIAHSLGSLHSTNVLYNMEQSKKDQIVAGVVTMGGPMLGAPKILKGALGGDDAFVSHIFALGDVGVNYHSQSMITNSASSLQDLQIKDTYFRHRTQPWMQELLKRVELENQYLSTKQFPSDNYPLSWFPSPKEICGAGFEARPNECLLLVQDLSEPFLFVKDKVYNASEDSIHSSLIDNSVQATSERVWQFFQEAKRPLADQLAHPGVPMIVIYGAHSMVPSKFTYNNNPRDVIGSTEEFYFPEKSETSQGDATVLTSSAITTAIKWIYEHNNGQTKYPTKLVEYCSEFKQGSVYDGTDAQGQKLIQSSGYLGLSCQCKNGKVSIGDCSHSCFINDPQLVAFIAEIVQSNAKSTISVTPLSNDKLTDHVTNCLNLK